MKKAILLFEKIEYEMPIFLILAYRLPYGHIDAKRMVFFALCLVTALFFGQVIRRQEEKYKIAILAVVSMLLSGKIFETIFMPSFTFQYVLYTKALSFFIFFLIIFIIRRPLSAMRKPQLLWIVPVLCVIGIIINTAFLILFVPVILLILAYERQKSGDKTFNAVFFATLLLVAVTVIALFSVSYVGDIKYLWFADFSNSFRGFPWREILNTIAVILPLIAIFAYIWIIAIKSNPQKGLKTIYFLCMAEPVVAVFINLFIFYIYSEGWEYYIYAAPFTQFCLVFYFLDSKDNSVSKAFDRIDRLVRKNAVLTIVAIIYLLMIDHYLYIK